MILEPLTQVIIPAAGYGKRMGSPPAKEILLRPGTSEAFIDAPIRWAQQCHWPILVITRKDKQPLIDYLLAKHPDVRLFYIDASEDWHSTVLQAKSAWMEHNILLLPDIEFQPLNALEKVGQLLQEYDVSAALHKVTDSQNWGHVWPISSMSFQVIEKPSTFVGAETMAWGLLGFRKSYGEALLRAQWQSQKEKIPWTIDGRLGITRLTTFQDLTR